MTASRLTELQNRLLGELAEPLGQHGFRRSPARGQTYRRPMAGGEHAVHVSVIMHPDDIDLTVDVAVRLDDLERLLEPYGDPKAKGVKRYTLGAELGNIRDGRPIRWTVTVEDDIPDAVQSIVNLIETVGLPYLEEFSQPRRALEVLRSDMRSVWVHCPVHVERAKRAVGLALLLEGPHSAAGVMEAKRSFLDSVRDPMKPWFEDFASAFRSVVDSAPGRTPDR